MTKPRDAATEPPQPDAATEPRLPDAATEPPAPGAASGPRTLAERIEDRVFIRIPARHNPPLAELIERINAEDEIYALWLAQNTNAVHRLDMSDHGPVHVQIVANSALRLLRLLSSEGVSPSVVTDHGLMVDDAEVVVVLAALFHDVGMSIHREGHEAYSLFVAQPILERLLGEVYGRAVGTIVRSEILHAIISHRSGGRPLTVEGGILRIADALDMAHGRSRIPFEAGSTSIHSVSAAAIEAVHIEPDGEGHIKIRVEMSNSAGVFQVDELLRKKMKGSGLEQHFQVEAVIEGEAEKRLVQHFRL